MTSWVDSWARSKRRLEPMILSGRTEATPRETQKRPCACSDIFSRASRPPERARGGGIISPGPQ